MVDGYFDVTGKIPVQARERVLATLDTARGIVAAQVLPGAYDEHDAPTRLDPLWQWLFANRKGLLQADGEG